ncbi:MAG: hypothetical protein QUS07_08285, partial [Methanothrix sp.]|nr:hypothetical protein [Methanothrix sp.]
SKYGYDVLGGETKVFPSPRKALFGIPVFSSKLQAAGYSIKNNQEISKDPGCSPNICINIL